MFSLPLLSLVIASFGIGTTEFVIVGLLNDVARDLSVTIPKAGLLVSGYALGVVVGTPLMASATSGLRRKTALLCLMALFTIGNVACAAAPSYGLLMAARVLTALAHGAFFGTGAVVAADLVAPNKRAQAIAMMFTGLTLANVLGVPFGTFLGHAAGWRMTFFAIAGIGLFASALIAAFVPKTPPHPQIGMLREFQALGRRQVVLPMLISVLASVSLFTTFTYIEPLLETVTGLSKGAVSWALLLFGAGLTGGNLLGGWLADREPVSAIIGSFAGTAVLLVGIHIFIHNPNVTIPLLLLWGAMVFSLVPPLQIWIVDAATDAPSMASSINHSAFNFGNATGAWLGGVFISAGAGYAALPLVSVVASVIALALTVLSGRDRARALAAGTGSKG